MGVPALFRWLSKKYPKIVLPVVEEEETTITDDAGEQVAIPINISGPNPNGEEFDNLYLDMNGIVHPCTHPEGKPAPETEEEMMVEVFKYTERVVNMVRPRKLLFMAIDGVAPRAKMNQQRSRRFRSAREAEEKDIARQESIAMWEAMGQTISEEEKNKKSWDSNAITPGTPFMDLLASSLRYWVAQKLNSDPGWKGMEVIISDASVPGEGEHKIMDFIRRQRSNPGHNPNTRHVIYGLDADLIMLSLATHEPHFRVLREDVFAQGSQTACRLCGQEGHYAAQCTAKKEDYKKPAPLEKKPFIFLDVAILREYLEAELRVANTPFPFNLEQAIDDWVLLIFFVGNDFLPHLPSLEIREGAIDTLLKIWRDELPRMGGYLTNHGQLELARAQIILEGLAKREDEIFRKRRQAEEREAENAAHKRRRIEMTESGSGPSSSLNLGATPVKPGTHPLPAKPEPSFVYKADSIGLGGPKTEEALKNAPAATQALAGSNSDWVANRRAIRLANLSAAEMFKAEMSGLVPLKQSKNASPPKATTSTTAPTITPATAPEPETTDPLPTSGDDSTIPGLDIQAIAESTSEVDRVATPIPDEPMITDQEESPHGQKRTHAEVEAEDAAVDAEGATADAEEVVVDGDDDESDSAVAGLSFKVNGDGTVEQEDSVKLWEPGYKQRYYKQKFGVEHSDVEFRSKVTKSYIEGMVWVLTYYYQGTPSWQWYYPYHFAPFAGDFEEVDKLDLSFQEGQPFKPFEQLMGVFPAASRKHIPEPFHHLMTNEDSSIIDFYPTTFEIDMNGKKMAWQGVALLPFIDEKRLLDAMAPHYDNLTDEERRRNSWGNNVLYVSEDHTLCPSLEALYGKRKSQDPDKINPDLGKGLNGSLLPVPDYLPGSTHYSPLKGVDLPDITHDRSLCALYFFPQQLTPHRSVLLPGVQRNKPTLTEDDREHARRGGRGRRGGPYPDRGGGRGGWGGPSSGRDQWSNGRDYNARNGGDRHNGGGYGGGYGGGRDTRQFNAPNQYSRGGYNNPSYNSLRYPPQNQYQRPQPSYNNNNGYNSYGGASRGRGGPPRGGGNSFGGYGQGQSYNNNQYGGYQGGGGGGGGGGGYAQGVQAGGYGGYNANGNNYGGYGGYGGGQAQGGYGGGGSYGGGPSRGGYGGPNRGRGRGGPRY